MTGRANSIGIAMVEREERVVAGRQCCRDPSCCGVAGGARGRPTRSHMIWIRSAREIRLVARVARGRRACENIIDVA